MKVNVTQHSQTGSTHVIIMILLVVALLGALGVVFYQNFIADKMDQTSTSQNDQSTDKTAVKTIRVAFDSKIYAFDYPDAWSAVIESPADGAKKIVLQNPSKSVRVNIAVGGGGLGGACDTNSPYKVRYYTVDSTAVTKLNDSKAYVVAAMVDAEGGGYNYRIGLTEDGGDTHAAVGDPACTTMYVGVASRLLLNGDSIVHPLVTEMIDFPKLAAGTDTRVREMQQVKDMIATDDYKAAVMILKSSRRE